MTVDNATNKVVRELRECGVMKSHSLVRAYSPIGWYKTRNGNFLRLSGFVRWCRVGEQGVLTCAKRRALTELIRHSRNHLILDGFYIAHAADKGHIDEGEFWFNSEHVAL